MSARPPLGASSGTTFLVYVVQTALASVPAWAAGAALDAVGGHLPGGAAELAAPGGALLLEAVDALLDDHAFGIAISFGAAAILSLVVSPGLLMAWLAAIEGPRSTARALAFGLRRYLPCVGLRLALALGGGSVVAPLLLLSVSGRALVDGRLDVRSADLLFLASLLPALLALTVLACLWDLAHAALARSERGVVEALRIGLASLRPGAVPAYATFAALGVLLLGATHLVSGALASPGAVGVHGALALGQLLLLARAFTRAAWLRDALGRTAPREAETRPPSGP